MKRLLALLIVLAALASSAGCAVVPIMVTGASFAVPQTVSMAFTGVRTVQSAVLVAADERHVGEIASDEITEFRAEAVALAEGCPGVDISCINDDLYVVGEVDDPEQRAALIAALNDLSGVDEVKGMLVAPGEYSPAAEAQLEMALLEERHVFSANTNVHVVGGYAVLSGVVGDRATSARLTERLTPIAREHGLEFHNILAIQDEYDAGLPELNDVYALAPGSPAAAVAVAQARPAQAESDRPATVQAPIVVAQAAAPAPAQVAVRTAPTPLPIQPRTRPTLSQRAPEPALAQSDWEERNWVQRYGEDDISSWRRARIAMKDRLLDLARTETDDNVRRELITISSRIATDRNTSIVARLVKEAERTGYVSLRHTLIQILAEITPNPPQLTTRVAQASLP